LDESGLKSSGDDRFDRELILFLNELRVALPGVQILFGFLLSVPFSARFEQTTVLQRQVYFVGFIFCAAASVLLIAPSVYHRLHWRKQVARRAEMLTAFNRLAVAGGICLAVAMTCVIFVIADFLVGGPVAVLLSALSAVGFAWFWFGLPAARRARERGRV
jgi:hypothetical protein